MLGMEMLDVLIGLATIYMVFGIACTAAVEVVVSWLKVRSRNLENALKEFLGDEDHQAEKMVDAFFRHPLVQSLSKGKNGRPSYIPPSIVSKVVESLLNVDRTEKSIRAAIDRIPDRDATSRLKGMLGALLDQAEDNVFAFRDAVENQFNATMDRASGWFKRYTQNVALIVATLLVLGGNVDSIAIATSLSANPESRAKLLEVAQQQLQVAEERKQKALVSADQDELKLATSMVGQARTSLVNAAESLDATGLQFGWKKAPQTVGEGLAKLAGLLISIVAISLGAPFWFSVLQRFMQVRGSGAAPETKKPQAVG